MPKLRRIARAVLGYAILFLAFCFVGLSFIVLFLWADGHVNRDKMKRIGAILREDPNAPKSDAPRKTPEEVQVEIDTARTALAERDQRWREEYALLSGALRTVKEELERDKKRMAEEREDLGRDRAEFDAELAADRALKESQSFQNNVRILAALSPKDGAVFVRDWATEVIVTYVRRLRERDAAKLLVELEALDAKKAGEVRTLLKDQALQAAAEAAEAAGRPEGEAIPGREGAGR